MNFSIRFLTTYVCFFLASLVMGVGQTIDSAQLPTRDADGFYEVSASELRNLDSSPKIELPSMVVSNDLADHIVIAVTISPEGKVKKTKVISGKYDSMKEIAERAVKKWVFQPYLVNGIAVPVRTKITVEIDNTFDHYHEPDGYTPIRLGEIAARALIIKSPQPEYPSDAQLGRIEGTVGFRVIIGEDGRVHVLHINHGHPMLLSAAYNAVRTWQFKPYQQGGKVLPIDTTLTVAFMLP